MKSLFGKIILFLFLGLSSTCFGQEKCIQVLEVNEIRYYYVYKVFEIPSNDTITIISSKLDPEFETIKLEKNKFYKVKTRLRSAIKISEEKHLFCKHAITIIENIPISDKYNLPVLVLDYKEVDCFEKCN